MDKKYEDFLIDKILEKNQLKGLSKNFIKRRLHSLLLTRGDLRKHIENTQFSKLEKNKFVKETIKKVREEIGQLYGQYLTQQFSKKDRFLDSKNLDNLLKSHKSTRERINFYDRVYPFIFEWYKPKHIVDLACGLNPLSYPLIVDELKYKPKYTACDLNERDMEFISKFFELHNIDGKTFSSDLTTLEFLEDEDIKNADLVFLFKALDSLESIQRNISKTILEKINAKHIVISFPTESLVSRNSVQVKRTWFFKFIEKMNWEYQTFEIENELFILLAK